MSNDHPELAKNPANFVPLSPVSFLTRAAVVFADRLAVVHGERRYTYRELAERCRRLASALARLGIGRGDTVAVMAPNGPPLLEAHYAVPMLGAVLNPINTRLDPTTVAFCLRHGGAKVLIVDRELGEVGKAALALLDEPPLAVGVDDPMAVGGEAMGEHDYEDLLARGDPAFAGPGPVDEWDSLCLLYTSGTTGDPKGAVYSHRGAYLAALGNALTLRLDHASRYLWTLPMFHCSGWTFTWAVTAVGGTHVCLRKVDPAMIFDLIARHGVTHMCGAPIVLNMVAHAAPRLERRFAHTVRCATGGAAPPSAVIAAMERTGFEVIHLYGTTESYGPATACLPWPEWQDEPDDARHRLMARQGVPYPMLEGLLVVDPETLEPVPADGSTLGEIVLRGNSVMKGYLHNPAATAKALGSGWLRTGDLAVWHVDGYVEMKDRAKDIIISGGENISSLEVEEALYRHPAVMDAAVVAKPDDHWGETPCAFVELKPDAMATADDIIAHCRAKLARFKAPRHVVFGPLPKTSTGKVQKFVLRDRTKGL